MHDPEAEHNGVQDPVIQSPEELYELAPCGYLTTAPSGRIIRINQTLLRWLGYDELRDGARFVDLLTAGGRIFYETHLAPQLRVKDSVNEIALDFVQRDGSLLPTLVNARLHRTKDGATAVIFVTVFDARERRLYERQLLAARDLFETTLASIGDGVVATDSAGKVTFLNAIAAELTGWDADLAVGLPIEDVLVLVREDTREPIEHPIRHALRTGERVGLENHTLLLSKNGTAYVVDDSAAPIQDEDGMVSGAVMVFRDVTSRRKAERELHDAYSQLEDKATELRRSNEDLSQFAYVASHDLRSPLKTVIMFSQLLERRYGSVLGEGTELLRQITDATKRMASLIEDLLRFSSLTSTRDCSASLIDANECLAAAVRNLESSVSESGASIDCDPLPPVAVEPTSLTQLFQNLIGNAIRYRSAAPPEIRITVSARGEYWCFACRDNGIGIPAEYREHIFEPFKRLHGQEVPGNGIGLAVCKKVVQRYGGTIWVDSDEGGGSTFFFTLPVTSPDSKAR